MLHFIAWKYRRTYHNLEFRGNSSGGNPGFFIVNEGVQLLVLPFARFDRMGLSSAKHTTPSASAKHRTMHPLNMFVLLSIAGARSTTTPRQDAKPLLEVP